MMYDKNAVPVNWYKRFTIKADSLQNEKKVVMPQTKQNGFKNENTIETLITNIISISGIVIHQRRRVSSPLFYACLTLALFKTEKFQEV